MELPDHLAALATSQWGVVTRRQLLDGRCLAGDDPLADGPPVEVAAARRHPAVAAPADTGPAAGRGTAGRRTGPWLSGSTAAAWHGLTHVRRRPAGPRDGALPRVESTDRVGVDPCHGPHQRAHRRSRPAAGVVPASRALVDAAAQAPDDTAARALIISAVQEQVGAARRRAALARRPPPQWHGAAQGSRGRSREWRLVRAGGTARHHPPGSWTLPAAHGEPSAGRLSRATPDDSGRVAR